MSGDQLRLWFLQKLAPGNPFYHYAELYRVTGFLDQARFENALHEVVLRHSVLRTVFPEVDGMPVAKVLDRDFFESKAIVCDQKEEINGLAVREARIAFDLSNGPLLRIVYFVSEGVTTHVLLTLHHIITDKWSMQIIRDEIATIYSGNQERLAPLETGFQELAGAENKASQESIEYWKEKLADIPDFLSIPTDFHRPTQPTFDGRFFESALTRELSGSIADYCRKQGLTPYMFLLAIFQLLLSRLSDQRKIAVGTPLTGRNTVETENMVGFFDHTQVIYSTVEGTFRTFVNQVKQTVGEAVKHRDVGIETILKSVGKERRLTHNPLFQVMFIFHKKPEPPNLGAGVSIDYEPLDFGVAKFDLTLFVSESDDRFSPIFEYSTDLFSEERISNFAAQYETLIRKVLSDDSISVSDLLKADSYEREIVLNFASGDEAHVKPTLKSILDNISTLGNKPAIRFEGKTVSYQELGVQSARVASEIDSQQLEGGTVSIELERGWRVISSIIGVLRSGRAYVPIDAAMPSERRDQIRDRTDVRLVIVGGDAQTSLPKISFDELSGESQFSDRKISSSSPAYVIHTSGSSGSPKSVLVSHQNLDTSNSARFSFYDDHPGVFLLMSPTTFDSSVAGIYWTLTSGGTLVVSPERIEQDIDALASLIYEENVTHTLLLPSLYESLLRYADPDLLSSLRVVITAGEALTPGICKRHFDVMPGTKLYNEYGPTEATVWATAHEIQNEPAPGSIPIGKPIDGYNVFILDDDGAPAPVSVSGNIFIGGAGVAKYLNGSEDAFEANRDFGRLYRTGDRGRWNPDGTIEFLGRADSQLKIRGYRVEPEEIDFHLRNLPEVGDALTFVLETQSQPESNWDLQKLIEAVGVARATEILEELE